MDPDRQVRESVQKLLRQVIKCHRSFLKPLIKIIGPKILGSLFDPVPTVSEASMISFTVSKIFILWLLIYRSLLKMIKLLLFVGLLKRYLCQRP